MAQDMYVMVTAGDCESVWATTDQELALLECKTAVLTHLFDFNRAQIVRGDIVTASEVNHEVRLFRLGAVAGESCEEVTLPVQEWINDALAEHMAERHKEEAARQDPEWAEYVRLREKFSGR